MDDDMMELDASNVIHADGTETPDTVADELAPVAPVTISAPKVTISGGDQSAELAELDRAIARALADERAPHVPFNDD